MTGTNPSLPAQKHPGDGKAEPPWTFGRVMTAVFVGTLIWWTTTVVLTGVLWMMLALLGVLVEVANAPSNDPLGY